MEVTFSFGISSLLFRPLFFGISFRRRLQKSLSRFAQATGEPENRRPGRKHMVEGAKEGGRRRAERAHPGIACRENAAVHRANLVRLRPDRPTSRAEPTGQSAC